MVLFVISQTDLTKEKSGCDAGYSVIIPEHSSFEIF